MSQKKGVTHEHSDSDTSDNFDPMEKDLDFSSFMDGNTYTSAAYGIETDNGGYRGMSIPSLDSSLPSFSSYDAAANQANLKKRNTQASMQKVPDKLEPGRLYVLNHVEFQNERENKREGSDKDVEKIREVFEKKFKLKTQVFENYTVAKVKCLVEESKSIKSRAVPSKDF